MRTKQIAWWLWALGTVLIVASWDGVVSCAVGWSGFGIGLVGSVYGWGLRPPPSGMQADKPVGEASHLGDLTIPEKSLITLYKDPAALFRIRLVKSLVLILILFSLLALSYFSGQFICAIIGYGILTFDLLYRLIVKTRSDKRMSVILQKYEAKVQNK